MNYLIKKQLKRISDLRKLSEGEVGFFINIFGDLATEVLDLYRSNPEKFTFNEMENYSYDWNVENPEEVKCCEKCNKPIERTPSKTRSVRYYECLCDKSKEVIFKDQELFKRVEWISIMHKQNLNGRETEDELFEAGILAGIEETEEIMYSEKDMDMAYDKGFEEGKQFKNK